METELGCKANIGLVGDRQRQLRGGKSRELSDWSASWFRVSGGVLVVV